MKEVFSMIKGMEMGNIHGIISSNIRENGKMTLWLGMELLQIKIFFNNLSFKGTIISLSEFNTYFNYLKIN